MLHTLVTYSNTHGTTVAVLNQHLGTKTSEDSRHIWGISWISGPAKAFTFTHLTCSESCSRHLLFTKFQNYTLMHRTTKCYVSSKPKNIEHSLFLYQHHVIPVCALRSSERHLLSCSLNDNAIWYCWTLLLSLFSAQALNRKLLALQQTSIGIFVRTVGREKIRNLLRYRPVLQLSLVFSANVI